MKPFNAYLAAGFLLSSVTSVLAGVFEPGKYVYVQDDENVWTYIVSDQTGGSQLLDADVQTIATYSPTCKVKGTVSYSERIPSNYNQSDFIKGTVNKCSLQPIGPNCPTFHPCKPQDVHLLLAKYFKKEPDSLCESYKNDDNTQTDPRCAPRIRPEKARVDIKIGGITVKLR